VIYCQNRKKVQEYAAVSLVVKQAKDHSQMLDAEMCTICGDESSVHRRQSLHSQESDGSSGRDSSLFQHCAICLEAFRVGEEVSWSKILMDCNHTYHSACIREWLYRSPGCPCCRTSFIHPNDLTVNCCFFGAKASKSRWYEKRDKIISKRSRGEFCIVHGLMIPSDELSDGGGEEEHDSDADIGTAVPSLGGEEEELCNEILHTTSSPAEECNEIANSQDKLCFPILIPPEIDLECQGSNEVQQIRSRSGFVDGRYERKVFKNTDIASKIFHN